MRAKLLLSGSEKGEGLDVGHLRGASASLLCWEGGKRCFDGCANQLDGC
jgi:hypothetical protein